MSQPPRSILALLHDDHMVTIAILDRLDALLRQRGAKSPPPRDAAVASQLRELAAFLDDEITRHFLFEEKHLFPLFTRAYDPGIPMMLQSEHEVIRPLAGEVAGLARTGADEGFTAAVWRRFHETAQELVEREVFHVQKEEMGFLPAMQRLIRREDEENLLRAYAGGQSTSS